MMRYIAIAMALAVAACTPRLPNEARPEQTMPPTAPYGLLVGMAVIAQTPTTPVGAYTASYMSMSFRQASGRSSELTLMSRNSFDGGDELGIPVAEDGVSLVLRPFALRLKGGRGEFVAFNIGRERKATRLTIDWEIHKPTGQRVMNPRTVETTESYLDASPVAPASFDVEPGSVRYIGRIGAVIRGTPGDCMGTLGATIGFQMMRVCIDGAAFIGYAPDVDLPLIRKRYPHLAGVEIEQSPLSMPQGSWPGLAAVMQRFSSP